VTPAATKAAAGAIEYLPMAVVGGLPAALARLRDAGVHVVGLDGAAATSLYDVAGGDGPVCLVLGAEGRGLSRLVRQRCDEVVALPMRGRLGSLNVSAAAALACFEIARRR
jgi:23S rRNA (guanosine2251-2'-O)-methyltransferase